MVGSILESKADACVCEISAGIDENNRCMAKRDGYLKGLDPISFWKSWFRDDCPDYSFISQFLPSYFSKVASLENLSALS